MSCSDCPHMGATQCLHAALLTCGFVYNRREVHCLWLIVSGSRVKLLAALTFCLHQIYLSFNFFTIISIILDNEHTMEFISFSQMKSVSRGRAVKLFAFMVCFSPWTEILHQFARARNGDHFLITTLLLCEWAWEGVAAPPGMGPLPYKRTGLWQSGA